MASHGETLGTEIRFAAQLHDSFCNQVRVLLFFIRMFQKFRSHRLSVDAGSHVVMSLVAQHADNLSSQGLVEYADHSLAVRPVAFSDGAILDMLTRPPANFFDIRYKWSARIGLGLWTHRFPLKQAPDCRDAN